MRIAVDISPLANQRTGVPHYCYCLLKHLVPLAVESSFVGLLTGMRPIPEGNLPHAIPYRRIALPTRLMYRVWKTTHFPRVDTFLGGADLYHATNYFLPPAKSARRVLTVHDLCFLARPELCSPKISRFFAKHVPAFLEQADAIIACSESTKSDVLRYSNVSPEKVSVAYEAADEGFAPMDRERAAGVVSKTYHIEGPFLLYVSTLEPRKNVPGLLRAFASLTKELPHKLVLVGAMGWNTEAIASTLDRLNLGDRVVRVGFVERNSDLAAFYSAADAFVFPTLYEGFGLPVLEAMACGCPVVTSNNTSIPEVAGNAALQVDAEDDQAIAAAIRRLLDDSGLRDAMSAKGLEQAGRFSWQRCASSTLDVYNSLV